MHELSLAEALVDQVVRAAEIHHLNKVREVEVEAGALKGIVPAAMREAFAIVTQGTLAEGARLVMTEVPASARCNRCGRTFPPRYDDFQCPDCHIADVSVILGDDLVLKSIA